MTVGSWPERKCPWDYAADARVVGPTWLLERLVDEPVPPS
jgi:hypothetical protein